MNLDEIGKCVPADWLDQHREEYIELSEKIVKVIMMAEARNKKWQKPLQSLADFEAFIESEARDRNLPKEKIRGFLMDAGKIKARNTIFDKYYFGLLPKDEQGNCLAKRKEILEFIKFTVEDAPLKRAAIAAGSDDS